MITKRPGKKSATGDEIEVYYQRRENKVVIGEVELIVAEKLWEPSQSQANAEVLLAADVLSQERAMLSSDKLIIFGSGNGLLTAYLAVLNPRAYIDSSEDTISSFGLSKQTVQANHLTNVQVHQDLTNPGTFNPQFLGGYNSAVILLPKGRKVARRWLIHAWELLDDHGSLYLVGANDEGVQAVAKDTSDLFGNAAISGYKKSRRIYRSEKTAAHRLVPGWANEPGIKPGTWKTFDHHVEEKDYQIATLPGVFSYDHIDEGTQLLIECIHELNGDCVLDMGCGNGILGMYAAGRGAKIVHMADNHLLSVVCAEENLRINDIANAVTFASDLFNGLPEMSYDLILSNPPFHSGKEVEYLTSMALISHGFQRLNQGGSLVIVANRFIRYQNIMRQVFGNVETIKENTKFHVLTSLKM